MNDKPDKENKDENKDIKIPAGTGNFITGLGGTYIIVNHPLTEKEKGVYKQAVEVAEKVIKESKEVRGKVLLSPDFNKITEKLLKSQLTHERNYRGTDRVNDLKLAGQDKPIDLGLVAVWESGDVEYFIKQTDLVKLKNQDPKVYVSQDKNIKLLLGLVEQQQFKNEEKRAEASFTFKEYAKGRGYTDEEIKTGGKFLTELKRDLFSGAYTTYKVDKIMIDGKEYIAHGLPNFYTILEPKNPKGEWKVLFNSFYADLYLPILKGEAKQYYTHYLKEVADRKTTEKPYLHFFYNQLVYRRQAGRATTPKKVNNLLKEMGVAEFYLARPQESFKVLKECLIYITANYPEELESVIFYNNYNKEKTKQMPLSSLGALEGLDYSGFKEILKALGVKDIRDAFISFCRHREIKKELPAPKTQDSDGLADQILAWADRCISWETMTAITRDGTARYLKDSLRLLGHERLNELFKQEAGGAYPNAVRFLTKTLPQELKDNKTTRQTLKDIGDTLKNRGRIIKDLD